MGLGRLELPTSPLSGVRSSHLSYRPNLLAGNILRRLAHTSNNAATRVSLDYDDGLSGTGAIAKNRRGSARRRNRALLNALGLRRAKNEPLMMFFRDALHDFGIVVGRSVRRFLACQRKHYACVIAATLRHT